MAFDAPSVASFINQARLEGVVHPGASFPPLETVERGYEVQDAHMHITNVERLGKRVGWKCGATNAAAQAALGFGPFYGPLFANFVKPTGGEVSLASLGRLIAAEAEFAFQMETDLPPLSTLEERYTEEQVWSCVKCIYPSIEIASSRVQDALCPSLIVADHALNGVCVLAGSPVARASIADPSSLSTASASLSINGKIVCTDTGTNVLGNPLASLTWIANALHVRGIGLKKDDLVFSGACCAHKTLAVGDILSAQFVGLGEASSGEVSITII